MKRRRCEPYLLPEGGEWSEPEEVEAYAEACLAAVGLSGWSFGWDRAVRRLGCCRYRERRITLSRYYVAAYLVKDVGMVRRTVLHEVAHALAMVHERERGHGPAWRYFCALLGIGDERATCRCDDFTPEHFRPRRAQFVLCHRVSGEVYRTYCRKPRMSQRRLAGMYIVGRKEGTLGQLCIRPAEGL